MKGRYRKLRRWISLASVFAIMLCTVPVVSATGADNVEENTGFVDIASVPANILSLIGLDESAPSGGIHPQSAVPSNEAPVQQIVDTDDFNSIRIEDGEGNGTAKIFATPVRYETDEGEIEFIDTSMTAESFVTSLFSGYDYRNTANDIHLQFSKRPTKGIRVDEAFTMAVHNPEANSRPNGTVDQTPEGNGRIVYPEAFGEHTYLEYVNINTGLKENIVLEENIGKNRFSFVFESEEYIPVLSDDGLTIRVVHKDDPTDVKYQFTPLYVYDSYQPQDFDTIQAEPPKEPVYVGPAAGTPGEAEPEEDDAPAPVRHFTEENHYEVTPLGNGKYQITSVVSEEFLNSPDTVYPVTIDPAFTGSNSNAQDTFVWKNEGSKTNTNGSLDYLRFGRKDGGDMISYFRFNSLPTLPNNVNITDARLKFTFRSGQTSGANGVCMIVTDNQWYENTLSWANQPYGDWGFSSSHNNYQYYDFYVCPFVEMWYYGGYSNFGVDFTYANMINDYNSCVSTEGEAHRAPTLTIIYQVSQNMSVSTTYSNELKLGDYHWYRFTAPATGAYTFYTVGSTDTYGELYQGTTRLAVNDDGGEDNNFKITHTLKQGVTYHLKIRGYNYEKTGNYTVFLIIPNETLFLRLDTLHQAAKNYDNSNAMKLTLQFIRRNTYNNSNWDYVAGEVDESFVTYIKNNYPDIYAFFSIPNLRIYDSVRGEIDFYHLCATMNGIILGGGTYWKALVVGTAHVRNLAGWAGDLQTLVVDTYQLTHASDNYNVFYNQFRSIMGSNNRSFSMADLLADVDAFNFANNWISGYWGSNLFGSACRYYYSNTDIPGTGWSSKSNLRFSQFIGTDTKEQFADTASQYTSQYWMLNIQWPIYESEAAARNITINLTKNQSEAAKDAFTDYIWMLYETE